MNRSSIGVERRHIPAAAATLAALIAACSVQATTVHKVAYLTGGQAVPPVSTSARGVATFVIDTSERKTTRPYSQVAFDSVLL